MKSFKEFTKKNEPLVAGYASIGHYKPIDTTPKISNIPVGYFSIGNRPEVLVHKQLDESVTGINRDSLTAKIIQEWVYDNGFDKDEYEADPRKFALQMATNEHPDEGGEKLSKLNIQLENHYHPYNATLKQMDFGIYSFDSSQVNKHLIKRHLDSDYPDDTRLRSHIEEIDKHLDNYSKLAPTDFHVYTGVGSSFHVHHIRQNNSDRMYLPAYTSTSLEPTIAEGFTRSIRSDHAGNIIQNNTKPYREMIRFHIPKGSSHGTYLGSTGYDGGNGHEHEFLLHRGTHIQFLGKPRVYPMITPEDSHIIVHDAKIIKHVRLPV